MKKTSKKTKIIFSTIIAGVIILLLVLVGLAIKGKYFAESSTSIPTAPMQTALNEFTNDGYNSIANNSAFNAKEYKAVNPRTNQLETIISTKDTLFPLGSTITTITDATGTNLCTASDNRSNFDATFNSAYLRATAYINDVKSKDGDFASKSETYYQLHQILGSCFNPYLESLREKNAYEYSTAKDLYNTLDANILLFPPGEGFWYSSNSMPTENFLFITGFSRDTGPTTVLTQRVALRLQSHTELLISEPYLASEQVRRIISSETKFAIRRQIINEVFKYSKLLGTLGQILCFSEGISSQKEDSIMDESLSNFAALNYTPFKLLPQDSKLKISEQLKGDKISVRLTYNAQTIKEYYHDASNGSISGIKAYGKLDFEMKFGEPVGGTSSRDSYYIGVKFWKIF